MSRSDYRLGEVADVSWGDTNTTKSSYVSSGFPAFSAKGQDGYLDHFDYNEPGVVVSAIGAQCGKSWFASGKWSCIKNTIRILAKPGVSDARYLYYAACAPGFFPSRGSAQPFIAQSDARTVRISLPPLAEQRRIAGVLGAMDELIEVNRGLVMSLLETVDAEFAREFVHRDLTLTLGSFTKIVDCLHSKKPERVETSHRLLQLSNIDDSGQLETNDFYGISRDDYVRWTKNLETREWDCVITNVGRVGAVARIPSGVHAALGRNMTAIRPIDPESDGAFVIAGLRAQPVRREIELRTDSGTVMDALNVKNIPSLRLPQASSDERAAFQSFAAPLLRAADDLRSENSLLASTRDELLPLLMSGRVRVAEVVAA